MAHTIKDQFLASKAYIERGQWDDARRVLKSIDHPKAQDWLTKIDQIDPLPIESNYSFHVLFVSSILGAITTAGHYNSGSIHTDTQTLATFIIITAVYIIIVGFFTHQWQQNNIN